MSKQGLGIACMKKIVFMIVLLNAVLIVIFFGSQLETSDTATYVSGARLIFDLPGGGDISFRMLKPLPLFFSGLFEKTTGLNAKYGFFAQNLVFYLISSFLIYQIVNIVSRDELQALAGVIIFITVPPLLESGLAYLTDMPGWFFGILGIYLTLKWFDKFERTAGYPLALGFIMGIGFLYKESALMAPMFFAIYVFLERLSLSEKVKIVLLGMAGFFIPVLVSSAVIYRYFHYTFVHWYLFNEQKPFGDTYNLVQFIIQIGSTLLLHWLLFAAGSIKIARDLVKKGVAEFPVKFLVASGASLLLWPVWAYPLNRIFYLSSPFLVLVASYGISSSNKKLNFLLVCLIGILDFVLFVLIRKYFTEGFTSFVLTRFPG